MISCKEMKLEDMTVTSQPNHPNRPIMQTAETTQQSIGSNIQRIALKIINSIRIRKSRTPRPKTFKSFLMKVIMSSAIILTPPRNSSASPR
ncbi:hypothetical protein ES703_91865 [subsurface metagenome]